MYKFQKRYAVKSAYRYVRVQISFVTLTNELPYSDLSLFDFEVILHFLLSLESCYLLFIVFGTLLIAFHFYPSSNLGHSVTVYECIIPPF